MWSWLQDLYLNLSKKLKTTNFCLRFNKTEYHSIKNTDVTTSEIARNCSYFLKT
uniref:Uncharacterized protein n=1 Tax=Anguilla anguilla TaxID=7936 RepID=A0A0E9SG34_ANGAN